MKNKTLPTSLVRRMEPVEQHRESLERLQDRWEQLALLGQLTGVSTDAGSTAAGFAALTHTLLDTLSQRLFQDAQAALAAQAQTAADILVRNLFERTADIGFLATDAPLRDFMGGRRAEPHAAGSLRRRLGDYVAKYTVYDDLVLLDPAGRVVLRLDEAARADRTAHDFHAQAMSRRRSFVECFAALDLFDGRNALAYACAVDGAEGRAAGVIALSFRLQDEAAGIFGKLLAHGDGTVLALVDASGAVLASSDAWQVPVGARLPTPQDDNGLLRFGSREWLAAARGGAGYQGYAGPRGWRMVALLPTDLAFRLADEPASAGVVLQPSHMARVQLFGEALQRIPREAAAIQQGLERAVWNGQVKARQDAGRDGLGGARFATALLDQVAEAGARIRQVFDDAIGDLQRSAVTDVLRRAAAGASLGVELLDRNLYERANDCRWWALDDSLGEAVRRPEDAGAVSGAARTLARIHALYSVYTQLILLDRAGRVLACSQPAGEVPQRLPADTPWLEPLLSLRGAEQHVRSPFARSPLYADRATYVFGAAVAAGGEAAGGVAIVFDAEPQLAAMLADILPRGLDGQPLPRSGAAFVERSGRVLSQSGAVPPQEDALRTLLCDLARGTRVERVVELAGMLYAVGASMAGGYREYGAGAAAAEDDVACVVFIALCESGEEGTTDEDTAFTAPGSASAADTVELAAFRFDGRWYGLPVAELAEGAMHFPQVSRMPVAGGPALPVVMHEGAVLPLLSVDGRAAEGRDGALALVCRADSGTRFAVRADALGGVFSVPRQAIRPLPPGLQDASAKGAQGLDGLVQGARGMLLLTSASRLMGGRG